MTQRLLAGCVGVLGILIPLFLCAVAPAANETVPNPPAFEHFFVPEADVSALVDQLQLRAMGRADFERLSADLDAARVPQPPTVRLEQATYTARFASGDLVQGRGAWTVVHRGTRREWLTLDTGQLALRGLRWQRRANQTVPRLRAGNDVAGALHCAVKESGTLLLDWSLAGSAKGAERWWFRQDFPLCARSRLTLTLPVGYAVSAAQALVLAPQEDGDRVTQEGGDRDWILEFGGQRQLEFEVWQLPAATEAGGSVRQSVSYQLDSQGVTLDSHIDLSVSQTIDHLVLETAPGMRVSSVELDSVALMIQRTSGPTVAIPPAPLERGQYQLRVTAVAPIVVDEPWKLPSIRIRGAALEQEQLALQSPGAIEIRDLTADGYVESGVSPISAQTPSERRSFVSFTRNPTLEVFLAYAEPRLESALGTSLRISGETMSARSVVEITAVRGNHHILTIETLEDWQIDSVETVPASALESLERTEQGRTLRVRLRKPVVPGESLQLIVQSHASLTGQSQLAGRSLRPLLLQSAVVEDHFLAISTESPLHLTVTNDVGVQRFRWEDVPNIARSRLELAANALVFRASSAFDLMQVQLGRQPPSFAAATDVRMVVDSGVLRQSIDVDCRPITGQLSQITVRLNASEPSGIEWTMPDERDGIVSAVRQRAQDGTGELWELTLRRPQAAQFRLVGVRRIEFNQQASLGLASIAAPVPTAQATTLTLSSADGTALVAEGASLRAIPLSADDRWPVPRIRYRYDPSETSNVLIRRTSRAGQPAALWIWDCQVASQFEPDGSATHRAFLSLENLGVAQLRVSFPEPVSVEEVSISGNKLPVPSAADLEVQIALPREMRYPTVQITFSNRYQPLHVVSERQAPWPRFEVPCLRRSWSVWLPPGYRTTTQARVTGRPANVRWDQRLFGFSMLRSGERPFRATNWRDWEKLSRKIPSLLNARRKKQLALFALEDVYRRSDPPRDFAEWLSRYASLSDSYLPPLYIDAMACRQAGLVPTTPLHVVESEQPTVTAAKRLAAHNLALVVHDEAAVVTPLAAMARAGSGTLATDQTNIFLAPFGRLGVGEQLDVRTWATLYSQRSVWEPSGAIAPLHAAGWSQSHYAVAGETGPSVTVVRTATLEHLGWSGGLIALGSGLLLVRKRRVWFIAIAAIAVITLSCPTGCEAPARGVFYGMLLGGFLRVLRPWLQQVPARQAPAAPAPAATVLVVVAGLTGVLYGQAHVPRLPVVLSPIDSQFRPTGDYVYVSQDLWKELHLRDLGLPAASEGSLIGSAEYSWVARPTREDTSEVTAQITATWQVESLRPQAKVQLPVPNSEAELDASAGQRCAGAIRAGR